jgi:hypothetical protein
MSKNNRNNRAQPAADKPTTAPATTTTLEEVLNNSAFTTGTSDDQTSAGGEQQGGEQNSNASEATEQGSDGNNDSNQNGTDTGSNGDAAELGAAIGDNSNGDQSNNGNVEQGAPVVTVATTIEDIRAALVAQLAPPTSAPPELVTEDSELGAAAEEETVDEIVEVVEGDEYHPTDEERLPWLFNYGKNCLPNIPQNTTSLWGAFCMDFPGMLGHIRSSPDVNLIQSAYKEMFEARTVDPEEYVAEAQGEQ